MNKEKVDPVSFIGWIASFLTFLMYLSYMDQIKLNLSGNQGSILLPIIATLNCLFWVMYGSLKKKKDWPIICCNIPGIIFGAITAITALK